MICFIINYYDEPVEQVQFAIDQVVGVYGSSAEIHALGDGLNLNLERCVSRHFAERLKVKEKGGEWTHRYLNYFLCETACSHLIKIDPDTETLAEAQNLPVGEAIFSRVRFVYHGCWPYTFVAGGALGFTRDMAKRIVDGSYFLHDRYKNDLQFGNQNDAMLREMIQRYGLQVIDRPDFCCAKRPLAPGASFFHR